MRATTAEKLSFALCDLHSFMGQVLSHNESAWSSITLTGTRHEIVIQFEGMLSVEAGESFVEALPEHEFRIPGQLVADASVREVDHRFGQTETLRVTCVLLLLEES